MSENFETMGEWLDKYNPFAMKGPNGKIRYFENYKGAYLYTLKRIRRRSAKGYFDLVLFFLDEVMNDRETAEDMVRLMGRKYPILRGDYLLLDWEDTASNEPKLTAVLKGLHMITETEYDYASFEVAWNEFKQWERTYEDADDASEDSDPRDDEEAKR